MSTIERLQRTPRLSRAVTHNGLVWLSGIVAADFNEDIAGQTRQVLARLDELLETAGTSKSRLLNVQIWLKDMVGDFAGMNDEWSQWVAPGAEPARATAGVSFDDENIRIEIVAVAAQ